MNSSSAEMRTVLMCCLSLVGLLTVVTRADDVRTCPPNTFSCLTVHEPRCIAMQFVCDGVRDCDVDESNCTTCSERGFFCDGGCIRAEYRCDGTADCDDGKDEVNCPPINKDELFKCKDYMHRKMSLVCDGSWDCLDDEADCTKDKCVATNATWCDNECKQQSHKCDHWRSCLDKQDEAGCPQPANNSMPLAMNGDDLEDVL